jgi:hypothetical protein
VELLLNINICLNHLLIFTTLNLRWRIHISLGFKNFFFELVVKFCFRFFISLNIFFIFDSYHSFFKFVSKCFKFPLSLCIISFTILFMENYIFLIHYIFVLNLWQKILIQKNVFKVDFLEIFAVKSFSRNDQATNFSFL